LEGINQTPNKLALNDVLDFISGNTLRHAKTSMKSIMERFTKAPYGFVEADVQWLVAKLFKEGDITFFVNNEVVTLLTKSVDEIYRYLSRKEYLERLLTEKRERASDKQKKAVKEVMKELFNSTPVNEEDDSLLKSFGQYASKLRNDLEKIEIHYKNESSYPGKSVVKNGKELLLNLLSIKYSTEFFRTVDQYRDELLDFAEDFEPVKSFFEGDQIDIWKRSLRLIKIYDESKTFIVDGEVEAVVDQIKTIMKKPAPYSEIRKIPELLDHYIELYGGILSEMEKPVFSAIEESRGRVLAELEGKVHLAATGSKEILSKKVYDRFAELTEKASTCNNVATLQNIKVEADALKVRLLNEIASEEARLIAAQQSKTPSAPAAGSTAEAPAYQIPKVKKQITISIKAINSETTWQIETEEDVDRYVENLKRKLKQRINEDAILNIEF